MKFNTFLFTVSFLVCFSMNSQEKKDNSKIKPLSIYTFSNFDKDVNSFSSLNKRLNLTDYKFIFADIQDMDLNMFSIDSRNFGKSPSEFIYDDYKRFQDRNLLKGFLLKNDPTRWNLQCQPPRLQ